MSIFWRIIGSKNLQKLYVHKLLVWVRPSCCGKKVQMYSLVLPIRWRNHCNVWPMGHSIFLKIHWRTDRWEMLTLFARCQFHQHLFVQMSFRQLFLVTLWLCRKIRTKNARVKCWWNRRQNAAIPSTRNESRQYHFENVTPPIWKSGINFINIFMSCFPIQKVQCYTLLSCTYCLYLHFFETGKTLLINWDLFYFSPLCKLTEMLQPPYPKKYYADVVAETVNYKVSIS